MAQWLGWASQDMKYTVHDPQGNGSNASRVELGVHNPSIYQLDLYQKSILFYARLLYLIYLLSTTWCYMWLLLYNGMLSRVLELPAHTLAQMNRAVFISLLLGDN